MTYNEIKPEGFLPHFIKCFWEYENGPSEVEYTILPDGCFDLIIQFENENLKSVILTGVWMKPVNVTIQPNTKLYAIRFKLLAAEYLFNQEIKAILNTKVLLPLDFWEIDKTDFSDFPKAVAAFSGRINLSLKHLKEIDKRKLQLFELVYQEENIKVSQLSEKVFWTSRQINRYFDQQFGFPLKKLLNILRTHSSYSDIAKGDLYPAKEYFDQAHFVKEVKKVTGLTPKELSQNKNDRFLQLTTTSGK